VGVRARGDAAAGRPKAGEGRRAPPKAADGVLAAVGQVLTVPASETGLVCRGLVCRLRRGGLASTNGDRTPPSSSRGVGGADRARLNCCRPRRARQWKQRIAFARLRGVQQQRRSMDAGRGRSMSSSIGSMLCSRSRRGVRCIVDARLLISPPSRQD
jgi:hypothetical protein